MAKSIFSVYYQLYDLNNAPRHAAALERNSMTILYCGDTSLNGAAGYLCGLMSAWGWNYRYIPSDQPLRPEDLLEPRAVYVFSDYPAAQADPVMQQLIAERVLQGAGLLMIGGWESYHGSGGNWGGTPLDHLLPVTIAAMDDRINFDQPTLLRSTAASPIPHPILAGLPWNERPPTIGGLNRVTPKAGSEALLAALSFSAKVAATHPWVQAAEGFVENWLLPPKVKETLTGVSPFGTPYPGDIAFEVRAMYPALTIGCAGEGRTAAFASDIAPHWVGGFVDWGESRVTAQAPGGPTIEVGNHYAQFWKQLLMWTGRLGV